MSIEQDNQQAAVGEHLKRVGASIEELNARIARLAIALGIDLDTPDSVERVIAEAGAKAQAVPPPGVVDRRAARGAHSGPDRRQTHKWVELRGLMVLRYGMERTTIENFGLDATRSLMTEVSNHMTRDGFKPGADGTNLDHLS